MQTANNIVCVTGVLDCQFSYSHESYGEKFFKSLVKNTRYSGVDDVIPIIISERLLDGKMSLVGCRVITQGEFRSRNYKDENGSRHVELYLFVNYISVAQDTDDDMNVVTLDGEITKDPVLRMTPSGREIADIILKVERGSGKFDYIPCICWGRTAHFVGFNLAKSDRIRIFGRVQSREYEKEGKTKVAYEVSVTKIDAVNCEDCY